MTGAITSDDPKTGLRAAEIIRRIADGDDTVERIAQSYLDRIAERDGAVEAWAHIDRDRVISLARRLDSARVRGPLHGLPIGIKDTFDTADMPSRYGSPIYEKHRPTADAACVAILRGAGALIMGKTVTTEFAANTPNKTRNPHNPQHTPGGSSSGSAAAVGAGMVPVALGSQTMGSLIRPAAYCGAVGFKPSYATINRGGVKSQAESLDTLGVMGTSVDDTAIVTSVLIDGKPGYFSAPPAKPARIRVYRGPDWTKAEAPAIAALDAAIIKLSKAGVDVQEIAPPQILRDAYDAQIPYVFYEMARGLSFEWLDHRQAISRNLRDYVEIGLKTSFADYLGAELTIQAARRYMASAFESSDMWLTLSAPGEAPGIETTGDIVFNRLWSALHLPAVTIPVARGPIGLPLGIQLLGAYRGDAKLIAQSRWIEACMNPPS